MIRKFTLMKTVLALFFVMMGIGVMGQTNTWDGSSSTLWNVPANWSLNLVPTAAHDVVIPDNFVVDVNTAAVCNTLTLQAGPAAGEDIIVNILLNNSLTVTGAVTMNAGNGNNDNREININAGTMTSGSISIPITGGPSIDSKIVLTTGTLNVSGNIVMAGVTNATYIQSTGASNINLGGSISGGDVLSVATSNFNFNGVVPQTIPVTNYAYGNLLLNNTNATGATLAGPITSAIVLSDVNVQSGTFNNGASAITLSFANSDFILGANTIFNLTGSSAFPTVPATGVITISPTSTVNYFGTTQNIAGLTYGDLQANGGLKTLVGNVNVSGTFNIGSLVELGAFNLTMGATSPSIGTLGAGGFGPTKMIIADGTGELRKTFAPGPAAGYPFPIGDNTGTAEYSPALLIFSANTTTTGYIGINVDDAKHPENDHSGSFLTRYWTVSEVGMTGYAVQVGFTYVDADISGVEANIRLAQGNGTGFWQRYTAASMNNLLNSMLTNPATDFALFDVFTGLDVAEILPVNFGSLRGWAPDNSRNMIEWNVYDETGVEKYEIEKLQTGDVFHVIGTQVPGNTGLDASYTFTDNSPNSGDNFYRIKGTEITGEITYSPVVRVRSGGTSTSGMRVYPNPVTGNTVNVSLQGIKAGKYQMVISNNTGQVIYRATTEQKAGNVLIQVPVSSSLPRGVYRVQVSNGENVMLSSFVKE